jgi:hypothetical protein
VIIGGGHPPREGRAQFGVAIVIQSMRTWPAAGGGSA